MTVEDMVNKLSSEGLLKNKEELLKTLKSGEGYNDCDTIKELKNKDKRNYAMEGYLFPDTYEYYLSATDEEIVNKLVKRFDAVFDDEMKARAKKLGMTVDQIVTLASIIEREGKAADFTKISAVLHNRLKKDMALQCDTTIKYVTGNKHIVLDGDELKVDTLYNTYTYKGLPPGPICNPGKSALHAALYPDEKYVEEKYLYFITADPEKGNLVFSKTLDEHNKAVKKYRPLWEAYDKKNNS
jgi:UPF0755 protein